jgi:Holliday junction resolvase RusA-like endonuclease
MPILEITAVEKQGKDGRMRKSRSQVTVKASGLVYMDPDYEAYTKFVKKCAMEAGIVKYQNCRVEIIVHIPVKCTDHVKKKNVASERRDRPDSDNVPKAIMDGLKGVAYEDDKDAPAHSVVPAWEPPESSWLIEVVIYEEHWTKYLSPEIRAWASEKGVEFEGFQVEPEKITGRSQLDLLA